MVTDVISSRQKTAKGVLMVQNVSQLIYCVGTVVLKGYSGAVQNLISILRNLMAMGQKQNRALEWVLVILGVVLGVWCNNLGLMGYLPIAANLQYTLAIFRFRENERVLKASLAVSALLFTVFSLVILNYVGVCTNLVIAVSAILALCRKNESGTSA